MSTQTTHSGSPDGDLVIPGTIDTPASIGAFNHEGPSDPVLPDAEDAAAHTLPVGAATGTLTSESPAAQEHSVVPSGSTAGGQSSPPTMPQSRTAQTAAGASITYLSEDQLYATQAVRENYTLPTAVLLGAAGLLLLLQGGAAFSGGGVVAAALMGALALFGLGIVAGISFLVATVLGKMFGEDYGGFGGLLLRVAAVCALYEVAVILIGFVLHPIFMFVFSLPVLVGVAKWLLGIDFFQAFVFAIVTSMVKFVLTILILSAIFGVALST